MRAEKVTAFARLLASSSLMAVACSDGDTAPGTGANAAATQLDIDGLCEAQCDRSAACSTSDSEPSAAECLAECANDFEDLGKKLRSDLVRALAACTRAVDCDESDDQCTTAAFETVGEDPDEVARSADVLTCLDVEQECNDTEGDFSDDLCGVLPFLVSPERQRMARCFDESCEDIRDCLAPFAER